MIFAAFHCRLKATDSENQISNGERVEALTIVNPSGREYFEPLHFYDSTMNYPEWGYGDTTNTYLADAVVSFIENYEDGFLQSMTK